MSRDIQKAVQAILGDFRQEMKAIQASPPSGGQTALRRFEVAVNKLGRTSTTKAAPPPSKPVDLFKRALNGDVAAQRTLREAVLTVGADEQKARAESAYFATVTGRRASVTKAGAPTPLPTASTTIGRGPDQLDPDALDELVSSAPAFDRNAYHTDPAAAFAAWMRRYGRVSLDPLTFKPIQRRLNPGNGTGANRVI
ncbi:MAG: hypothetical protein ACYDB4_17830 [Candidatus Dormibacteraceae bacterium]